MKNVSLFYRRRIYVLEISNIYIILLNSYLTNKFYNYAILVKKICFAFVYKERNNQNIIPLLIK